MRIFIGYLPIMFSDVIIGNPYSDVMKQPFSVPLPVPPDWYWSLSYMVLDRHSNWRVPHIYRNTLWGVQPQPFQASVLSHLAPWKKTG